MGYVAAAAVVSSYVQSEAAKKSAKTQQDAANAALQQQQSAAARQQALLQPYAESGTDAIKQLTEGLKQGGALTQQYALQQAQQQGQVGAGAFKPTASPAEQFAQAQAMDAMRNQMALGGQNLGTNAIVGAGKLAGNIASQYEQQGYNQWLTGRQQILAENQAQQNQLYRLANMGYSATSEQGTAGVQAATQQGQTMQQAAAAQAAGQVGQANAISSGLMGAAGMYTQYNLGQQQNQALGNIAANYQTYADQYSPSHTGTGSFGGASQTTPGMSTTWNLPPVSTGGWGSQ